MPYADKKKQRAFQAEWIKRRRTDWLKANGPCRKCGSWDALEVDHRDRGFKTTHRIWSFAQVRRDAELQKCQVLCRPCHKRKTRKQLRALQLSKATWKAFESAANPEVTA